MAEGVGSLLKTGLVGAVLSAICCFTPVLVWGLSLVGLGAAISFLEPLLLAVLAGSLALIAFAIWRGRK